MNSAAPFQARVLLLVVVALASAGCELVGDIFQAGMTVGILAVVLVVALVFVVISRLRA
jgi:hypothetical protein